MHDPALFKWRHFEADIILCAVRWYLRYALTKLAKITWLIVIFGDDEAECGISRYHKRL
jgi:hypothetical protein